MLKLKPNCECCGIELPPDATQARICSFECTFCEDCSEQNFTATCPNCTGELIRRPIRPAKHLAKYPASDQRFINQDHAQYPNFNSRSLIA